MRNQRNWGYCAPNCPNSRESKSPELQCTNYVNCPTSGCLDCKLFRAQNLRISKLKTLITFLLDFIPCEGLFFTAAGWDFNELPKVIVNHNRVWANNQSQCLWWHESNTWWLGSCENIGENMMGYEGYAYAEGEHGYRLVFLIIKYYQPKYHSIDLDFVLAVLT